MAGQNEHDAEHANETRSRRRPVSKWVATRPLFTWIAGILAVALGGVVTAWAVNLFGPQTSGHHTRSVSATLSCGPRRVPMVAKSGLPSQRAGPFKADVYTFPRSAGDAVFPQKIELSAAALSKLHGSMLGSPGSYDGSSTAFDLTLTARRPVRILQMSAYVLSRRSPLTGTIYVQPSAGTAASTKLYFKLDGADLAALGGSAVPGQPGANDFFRNYTLTLAPREQQTLSVTGAACRSAVQWILEITFLEGKSTTPKTAFVYDSHHKPFQTTALAHRYGAAYMYCDLGCGSGPPSDNWSRDSQLSG